MGAQEKRWMHCFEALFEGVAKRRIVKEGCQEEELSGWLLSLRDEGFTVASASSNWGQSVVNFQAQVHWKESGSYPENNSTMLMSWRKNTMCHVVSRRAKWEATKILRFGRMLSPSLNGSRMLNSETEEE
ncbi:hypothetical protein NC653_010043 [Populus alba x Populus x berolinensis]|uniref:Uncharacterized protein n=1 Tax=Populus alba x Populus x berolinensis TaxID=444605 RepID=A0AAD6QZ80_9ROSI|nr:hypothetical protein NC653_010043 [Populus alba x Populus x berolinensis]